MTRYEQEYYANIRMIRHDLDNIAESLSLICKAICNKMDGIPDSGDQADSEK